MQTLSAVPVIAYHDHLSPSTDTVTRTEYRIRCARLPDLSPDDLDTLRRTFGDGWQYEVHTRRAEDDVPIREEDFGPYLIEQRRTYGASTDFPEVGLWSPLVISASIFEAYSGVDSFAGYRASTDRRTALAIPTDPDSEFAAYLALTAQRYIEHNDYQRLTRDLETARETARDLKRAADDTWRRLCSTDAGPALAHEWEACVLALTTRMAADPELAARLRSDVELQVVSCAAQSALTVPARRKAVKQTMAHLRQLGIEWKTPTMPVPETA